MFGPIPKDIFSSDSDQPFDCCIMCQTPLKETGAPYMIEKAYVHHKDLKLHEVKYEYAICIACGQNMHNQLSKDSRAAIEQFFSSRVDMQLRYLEFQQDESMSTNYDAWTQNSLLTEESRHDLDEYVVYAMCEGDQMVYAGYPFILSMSTLEQLQGLLSKATKDILDDFMDEHFGLPPEIRQAIKDGELIFI